MTTMRLPILAITAFSLIAGPTFAKQPVSTTGDESDSLSVGEPTHPHHLSAAARKKTAKLISAQDTPSQIGQIPPKLLGPAGNRIPEVGPPPPKVEATTPPAKENTANCTGANASSAECYAATQQGKPK